MIYIVKWPNGQLFIYKDEQSAKKNMLPGDKLYYTSLITELLK